MKIRRLLSFALAFVVCCALVSCSYRPIEPTDDDMTVVGMVGDKPVYMEELRFVTNTYRQLLTERYGEDIFEGEDREYYLELLREQVYKNITADYAVIALCEEAYIYTDSPAILDKVDQRMNETVEEMGGMREYKKFLKENCLTDHMLRRSVEISLMQNELLYVYVDDILIIEDDDDAVYELIKNEFILVRHIFVPHSEENARSTIEDVERRLEAGENFNTLLATYGKDEDMTAEGLFILDGYMTDDYEKVAFDLLVGERSGIVEDEHGYYVIERLEMSPSAIMLKLDYLKELYQTYTFYSIIDERQTTLTFVPNDAGINYMADPF